MAFAPAFAALIRRGLIADHTPTLATSICAQLSSHRAPHAPPPSVYAGFDPTAPSLHLGHAAVLVLLLRLQAAGLRPIGLIGGATALIGDPTGKSADRPLLQQEAVAANAARIRAFLGQVLGSEGAAPIGAPPPPPPPPTLISTPAATTRAPPRLDCLVVDNAGFYSGMGAVGFLRDVGRHFRLAQLLARDSVKGRMGWGAGGAAGAGSGAGGGAEGEAEGMSFTEFAYPLLQAHDYATLHRAHGAALQVGGSDQWGNITAGVEHIRRLRGAGEGGGGSGAAAAAHGATVPLLLDAAGRKFGKSEGNAAVWLDAALTSHLALWQHLAAVGDAEAPRLLAQLTLLPEGEVAELVAEGAKAPERKAMQAKLADEVVALLRGRAAAEGARRTSSLLFAGSAMWAGAATTGATPAEAGGGGEGAFYLPQHAALPSLRAADLRDLGAAGQLPQGSLAGGEVAAGRVDAPAALLAAGLCKSRAEARRLVEGGGVYWNWERVSAREGGWAAGAGAAQRLRPVAASDFVGGEVAVLSVGKKRMGLVVLQQ